MPVILRERLTVIKQVRGWPPQNDILYYPVSIFKIRIAVLLKLTLFNIFCICH
jgi:hypothetical protein